MRPEDSYEEVIANIDAMISDSAGQIEQSLDSVTKSLHVLFESTGGHLTRAERTCVQAYEILFAGAMYREAWLLHRRGDHADAKRALAAARKLQEATQRAMV